MVLVVMETTDDPSTKVAFIVWICAFPVQLKYCFTISSGESTMGCRTGETLDSQFVVQMSHRWFARRGANQNRLSGWMSTLET